MEYSGVLPTTQFAYRKVLGTCDALLCMSHTLQTALESRQTAKIVQVDFNAAFDKVNHQGIYISSVQWVLEVLQCQHWQVLSNRTQHVMVNGWRSKLVSVVTRSLTEKYFGPVIVPHWPKILQLLSLFSSCYPFWRISWSVLPMIPRCNLLCPPQALELQ